MNNPTTQTYTSLATAFDFFNRELFSGSLPACLITMQRHKGAYGYFFGERFANTADPKEVTDEIALNPVHFATQQPVKVLSSGQQNEIYLSVLWVKRLGETGRTPCMRHLSRADAAGERAGGGRRRITAQWYVLASRAVR